VRIIIKTIYVIFARNTTTMNNLLEKFLKYVSIDTRSDENSETQPSSNKEFDLLNLLAGELKQMGISAEVDNFGYVYARIPSNIDDKTHVGRIPAIGLIAHVDTSPDAPGAGVKPQIIRNYDGGDILLKGSGDILSPHDFPELKAYAGQTIITTDGTTLLGADDKAGVAEIMGVAEYLTEHPEIKHGDICIAFTPDEEIGHGVDHFDVAGFGADFAYTIDGGAIGELEYENFNAASACIIIKGRNIHPGYAKGKMLNSMHIAMEIAGMLPADQRPEHTEGYEGFFHLTSMEGTVEQSTLKYIIRDHDCALFEKKKDFLQNICDKLDTQYGHGCINCVIKDQYYNMRKMVEPHMELVDNAKEAMIAEGVTPIIRPIRGGTDGAMLSFRGLPCPNIFTGGHNFHGRFEYVPYDSMEAAFRVILRLTTDNRGIF